VAEYGDGDFEAAEATLRNFALRFPKSVLVPDALNMMGDILASWGQLEPAIALYQEAISKASTMIAVNYGTFQIARVYELKQRYEDIVRLFRQYLADHGTNANFTEAYYWIGNAQMQQQQPAEALDTFFEAIVKYGNEPKNYGIDFILRDVAYEQSDKIAPEELTRFLDKLRGELIKASVRKEATLELRLTTLFAETQPPGEVREKLINSLLRENNIKDASPLTLSVIGREALARKDKKLARQAYELFLEAYRDSDLAVEVLPAVAELAIEDSRYDDAATYLQEMIARFASTEDAGLAQKRLGDVYRLQKQYATAIDAYNTVLGVREWKGPMWPESLYWIGVCQLEQNKVAEAFAYFQRIYVLYQGFPEWAAKAYLQSAACLEKLGRANEAVATYREMLQQEQLAGRPELATAREALQRLGAES
jgi:TolA-binding protein